MLRRGRTRWPDTAVVGQGLVASLGGETVSPAGSTAYPAKRRKSLTVAAPIPPDAPVYGRGCVSKSGPCGGRKWGSSNNSGQRRLTTRTVLPARRAAPAENTPLAITTALVQGEEEERGETLHRRSVGHPQQSVAISRLALVISIASLSLCTAFGRMIGHRAASLATRQSLTRSLSRSAPRFTHPTNPLDPNPTPTPTATPTPTSTATATGTAPRTDSTTHFGFRDVPEQQKENLGETACCPRSTPTKLTHSLPRTPGRQSAACSRASHHRTMS